MSRQARYACMGAQPNSPTSSGGQQSVTQTILAVSRLSPTVALGIAYYIQSCLWNLYVKADAGPKQAGDLQTFIVSEQVRAGMAVLDIQKDQTCI